MMIDDDPNPPRDSEALLLRVLLPAMVAAACILIALIAVCLKVRP